MPQGAHDSHLQSHLIKSQKAKCELTRACVLQGSLLKTRWRQRRRSALPADHQAEWAFPEPFDPEGPGRIDFSGERPKNGLVATMRSSGS